MAWREKKQAFSGDPAGHRSPQEYARTLADTREFKKNAKLHTQFGIDIGGGVAHTPKLFRHCTA